ncbi:unnamed protein product [Prunus armeniaca]|uniref:Uncharacterized protein n=1 Tax=Prunus armeniaca TaxID=36596 RepID=A0A6J5YAS0_PRUAR|nr:unnamed protein product [Prunus armeniaca]
MIKSVSLLNCKQLCDTLAHDVAKIENILLNEGSLCSVFLTSKQSQFDIVFPGSEVLKWFSHREDLYELNDRSEFSFQFPLNFKPENKGLAICAAAEISQTEKEITQSDYGRCYFTARIDINAETFATHSFNFKAKVMKSAHVWLLYIPFVKIVHYLSTPFTHPPSTCRVSLEHTSEGSMCCTSYGVHLVMLPQDEDLEDEETHEDLEDEYFTYEDDEDMKDDEVIAKKTTCVEALASQYPKGTSVEDYPFLRRNVMIMDALGVRHGQEMRGLRFGRFHGGGSGSSHRHAALIGCRRHN